MKTHTHTQLSTADALNQVRVPEYQGEVRAEWDDTTLMSDTKKQDEKQRGSQKGTGSVFISV